MNPTMKLMTSPIAPKTVTNSSNRYYRWEDTHRNSDSNSSSTTHNPNNKNNSNSSDSYHKVLKRKKLLGVARTVQLTQPNDFLAVLHGLYESQPGEVLVINTLHSTRAVAGGLFVTEAYRRGLAGMIVDGPVRDVNDMNLATTRRNGDSTSDTGKHNTTNTQNNNSALYNNGAVFPCYATCVSPYSGTTHALGQMQVPITCADVTVSPGDVVLGDEDGVVVAPPAVFGELLDLVEQIQGVEQRVTDSMKEDGQSLFDMVNFEDHLERRRQGKTSVLEFK